MADVLDDVFEASAPAFRDEPQQRLPRVNEGGADRAKGHALFRNPVQSVEGNHPVEFFPIGQAPDVGNLEAEVGPGRGAEVAGGKGDHVLRRIDAEHRAARDPRGNLRRNLPVAAADVQDAFGPLQR